MINKISYQKEYLMLNPNGLQQAPEHLRYLSTQDENAQQQDEFHDTTERVNAPVAVKRIIDGQPVYHVIDGLPTVQAHQAQGTPQINVCVLTLDDDNDVLLLALDLQRSKRTRLHSQFLLIEGYLQSYPKKQGFRNDVKSTEQTKEVAGVESPKWYHYIAARMNVKPNFVKYVHKVGTVRREYFERIENSRYTLYQAYQDCLAFEKGDDQQATPKVSQPVYHSTTTGAPTFSESSSTFDHIVDDEENTNSDEAASEMSQSEEPTPIESTSDHSTKAGNQPSSTKTIHAICPHCGEEVELPISE